MKQKMHLAIPPCDARYELNAACISYTIIRTETIAKPDPSIAKVGAGNGKVTGVSQGSTRILVYAANGVYKKITVTVK